MTWQMCLTLPLFIKLFVFNVCTIMELWVSDNLCKKINYLKASTGIKFSVVVFLFLIPWTNVIKLFVIYKVFGLVTLSLK
jgi:hypothetical protein